MYLKHLFFTNKEILYSLISIELIISIILYVFALFSGFITAVNIVLKLNFTYLNLFNVLTFSNMLFFQCNKTVVTMNTL